MVVNNAEFRREKKSRIVPGGKAVTRYLLLRKVCRLIQHYSTKFERVCLLQENGKPELDECPDNLGRWMSGHGDRIIIGGNVKDP